jgi:hypothetical protein
VVANPDLSHRETLSFPSSQMLSCRCSTSLGNEDWETHFSNGTGGIHPTLDDCECRILPLEEPFHPAIQRGQQNRVPSELACSRQTSPKFGVIIRTLLWTIQRTNVTFAVRKGTNCD